MRLSLTVVTGGRPLLLFDVPSREPLASRLRDRPGDVLAPGESLELVLAQVGDELRGEGERRAGIVREIDLDLVRSRPFAIERDDPENVFGHVAARAGAHHFVLFEARALDRRLSPEAVVGPPPKEPPRRRAPHRPAELRPGTAPTHG